MKNLGRLLFRPRCSDPFSASGQTTFKRPVTKSFYEGLQFLPINLFGAVMGIAGLSLAWRLSAAVFGTSQVIPEVIGAVSIVLFIVLMIAYVAKSILFTGKVVDEFVNPTVGNFFGTFPISILLLSIVIYPYSATASYSAWIIGTLFTIVLAYVVVARLMRNKQDLLHATPAWLIPGVGTLDVAVAGGTVPFSWAQEVSIAAFAIGVVLALVFFVLIMSRLMHHDPMPARLTPSLIILVAPFEVGFLAYVSVSGGIDLFASILFYFGLFLFVILFFKVFKRNTPFMITMWAVGFPIAALSNAALKYAMVVDLLALKVVAAVILWVLTLVLFYIFFKSIVLLLKGQLFKH